MVRVNYEKLKEMQSDPSAIRNISILAHVDHGKTSIADLLLATNAILSKRQAGMLRYLDNRPDEQRRGITMKSSTVSLYYSVGEEKEYLINVIDSPGHIDFASEVSAAARISDGTLIVVDVVEGMCAQTVTALETAIREKTRMILLLNKMDRLFLEKSMDTEEIHLHLTILLETINACVADVRYKELTLQLEELGDLEQADDEFSPNLGNVIFASAIDGWAFRINDFAEIYSKQLDISAGDLLQYLWGDYYFDRKTKGFNSGARDLNKKPLFITMILENILALYENIIIAKNCDKIAKIIEKLNLKNKTREMTSKDKRIQLRAIMSEWLPLADTVLSAVIEHVPSPKNISEEKSNHILGKDVALDSPETNDTIEPFIKGCSTEEGAPVLAYVTKVYTIDRRNILSLDKRKIPTAVDIQAKREAVRKIKQNLESNNEIGEMIQLTDTINLSEVPAPIKVVVEEEDHLDFIACVRIFSGTLKLGDELYLLPSIKSDRNCINTENNTNTNTNTNKIKIDELFMLLGKDVLKIESSIAGNIIGIGNLKKYMIRTGTLSSTLNCIPLIESRDPVIEPFYKCAIEPKHISDMQSLLQGVKLLIQSDSCAQCILQENGQYVLMTAGHVHLEKCVEDLKSFTNVEFKMSSPMVQLRETLVLPVNKTEEPYESKALLGMGLKVSVFAYPMPSNLQQFIIDNFSLLKRIEFTKDTENHKTAAIKQLKEKFQQVFTEIDKKWENVVDRVLTIGDSANDACILVNMNKESQNCSIFNKTDVNDPVTPTLYKHIINGFQLAIRAGPICDEPMRNILFYIKHLELIDVDLFASKCNAMTGVILKEMKVLIHKTFSLMQPRLMEPMYSARMTVDTNLMGKLQNRLDQYRGKITETYLVAKGLTDVVFVVPVLESPEFCNKLRADTQGKINPLLHFSHFELLDQNPYNIPVVTDDSDEDEIENNNICNKLMNEVRKRKGLRVDEKIVDFAEKQRTLNKKK